MSQSILFTPLQVGALELPNRIIMAPLTRRPADPLTCTAKSGSTTVRTLASDLGLILGRFP